MSISTSVKEMNLKLTLTDARAIEIVKSIPVKRRDEVIEKYIILGERARCASSEESLLESRRRMILDRVLDWIKNRTPEEFAVEIFAFTKKEQTEVGLDYDSASRHFWESKGSSRIPNAF